MAKVKKDVVEKLSIGDESKDDSIVCERKLIYAGKPIGDVKVTKEGGFHVSLLRNFMSVLGDFDSGDYTLAQGFGNTLRESMVNAAGRARIEAAAWLDHAKEIEKMLANK